MGREIDGGGSGNGMAEGAAASSKTPRECRPGILLVGPPNVGKRTLVSRLLSVDFSDEPDSWTGLLCHGWTIDTKYYSADLSIWTGQLDEEFSLHMLPVANQLDALVMVFDMNDVSSFTALQKWVSATDIQKFEIVLCVGNKVDLLPGHFAHMEYRRRLQRLGENTSDPHLNFLDYGIAETEGSSLLGEEVPLPSSELRNSCLDWCSQYNIEFIEACASNSDFDKCLSIDGDMQGVDRLFGAISAHMWPGMTLKSGDKILRPCLAETEEYSDEESEYELEYEHLSAGSDELWVDVSDSCFQFNDQIVPCGIGEEQSSDRASNEANQENKVQISASTSASSASQISSSILEETGDEQALAHESSHLDASDRKREDNGLPTAHTLKSEEAAHDRSLTLDLTNTSQLYSDRHSAFDDLEQLMNEIGNIRENLRLMPDFQRREMAAKLAMKMAVMFGESDDEEIHE